MSGLLTALEVAERLRVSRAKVYEWASAQRIACLRYPGRGRDTLRFRPEDVEEFLQGLHSPARKDNG